jgi:hypothetical protein
MEAKDWIERKTDRMYSQEREQFKNDLLMLLSNEDTGPRITRLLETLAQLEM